MDVLLGSKYTSRTKHLLLYNVQPTENFSEAPAFRVKSNWNQPKGHPAVEIFLTLFILGFFGRSSAREGAERAHLPYNFLGKCN